MKLYKKALLVLVAVFAGTLIAAGIMYQTTFGPVAPPPDAVTELPGGALMIPDGYVMVFAIPIGGNKVVLVDCGNDVAATRVKQALAARSLTVEAILVTHGHPDHVGGCNAIGAPVLSLEAEIPYVKGEQANEGPIPKLAGAHKLGVHVARGLKDGEVLTYGDKTFHVLAVPGHTVGSAVYLVAGILYFGDAASAGKNGKVIAPPKIFSDDAPQAVASLAALGARLKAESLAVTTFAFAHSATLPARLDLLAAVE